MSSDQSIWSIRLTSHSTPASVFFVQHKWSTGRTTPICIQDRARSYPHFWKYLHDDLLHCVWLSLFMLMIFKRMDMTVSWYVLCIFTIKTWEKAYFPPTDSNTDTRSEQQKTPRSEQLTSGASPNSTPPWASLKNRHLPKECWWNTIQEGRCLFWKILRVDIKFERLDVSSARFQTVKIKSHDVQ